MPFLLDGSPSESEISEAVNYLLANFDSSVSADPNTGQISGPTGEISGYLYKYMAIKYADSFDGSVNFSNSPTNRLYFGLRNNNDPAESSNFTDYIWYQATGGFGVTKSLWYIATGGRQIQFAVSVSAPDTGWLVDPGSSIDLDVVTSGNIPVIAEAFIPYFTPNTLQVPRTGTPLAPVFTNIVPVMYATDAGAVVPFTDAQTDTAVNFLNNTWRIGNSSTTGNGDISYTNITIGNPTDAGDYAQFPSPTAMSASPAYITVPVRYKNSFGVVAQAGVATVQLVFTDPGQTGPAGPTVEINGYTAFVQNAGGAYTPPSATLSAVVANIIAPTYSWTISGATPTSASTASVVVTPTGSSTGVSVSLTVNGSNLLAPITKAIQMPVVYDGAPGQAGQNGLMSAFPSIYLWTGSSTPPTRPSTTSTYTWSTGAYTAPAGWSTAPPSNTVANNFLWSITVPLNVVATTVTSTLNWTDVTFPIRAIAYNGANGSNGTNGTNGTNGANGSATFVVTRSANDSSPPSNAEVTAVIGRNPVAGDIVTVSYNIGNNAVVYRYTTNWVTQATYLTGSLIVDGTITGSKVSAGTITGTNIAGSTITGTKIAGSTITGTNIAGSTITATNIASSTITAAQIAGATITAAQIAANTITSGQIAAQTIVAANIAAGTITSGQIAANTITASQIASGTITSGQIASGTITSGQIASGTIAAGNMAANSITVGNAAIADGTITTAKISDAAITNAKIGSAAITTAKIGTAQVDTLQIAGQAVTIPVSAFTVGSIDAFNNLTTSWKTVQEITFTASGNPIYITTSGSAIQGYTFTQGFFNASFRIARRTGGPGIGPSTPLTTNSVGNPALNITDNPPNGVYGYELQMLNPFNTTAPSNTTPSISNRSMYALETKR